MTSLESSTVVAPTEPSAPIAALFDAHCGFVCRVLRRHGVHEASLDDAVQDVFVTAYRRWSSFEGRSSARSWLFGIARRIAYRYRRSADARARHAAAPDPGAPDGVDEPFTRVQAAHSLATLLDRLDADKRAVFVLHEVEGLTAPEVADALGLPVGTVYSRLRAAWQGLGREAERERVRLRRQLPTMRAPDPPEARRRRMWGLVVGGLGSGSPAGPAALGTGWLAQIKWAVVGAALGAGLLGARAAVVASSRAEVRPSVRARADDARPALRPEPAAPRESARSPAPTAAPATTSTEPAAAPRPRARPTPRPRPPAPPRAAEPTTTPDALTAELSLVQRAQQALATDRAEDALDLLAEHERRFPRGQLADERRRTRIKALCAAGRREQAAAEARALGRDPATACS